MLPLEAVFEYEPNFRVRMKNITQEVLNKRSVLWRLKGSVASLAASLERVSCDLEAVSSQIKDITETSLSEKATVSIDWLDGLVLSFRNSGESLSSFVVSMLDEHMRELHQIQHTKDEQQKAEKQVCAAIHQFARLPESKATDRDCFVLNSTVYEARKNWHKQTLSYSVKLNSFSMKQKTLIHTPIVNMIRVLQQLSTQASKSDRLRLAISDLENDHLAICEACEKFQREQQLRISQLLSSSENSYYLEIDKDNPFQEEVRCQLHLQFNFYNFLIFKSLLTFQHLFLLYRFVIPSNKCCHQSYPTNSNHNIRFLAKAKYF